MTQEPATQYIKIVKDKDDFTNVVEIKENAKGEPQVSVKVRNDANVKEAGDKALEEYTRLKLKLLELVVKK